MHTGSISSAYPFALQLKRFLSDADFLHCLHLVWDTDRPRQSVKDILFSSGLALLVLSLCRCKLNRLMPPPALNIQHGRPLLCIGFTNCNKKESQPFCDRAKQTNILSDQTECLAPSDYFLGSLHRGRGAGSGDEGGGRLGVGVPLMHNTDCSLDSQEMP